MKKFISLFILSTMLFTSSVCSEEVDTNFWAYDQIIEANADGWLDESLDSNDYALKSTAELAAKSVFNDAYAKDIEVTEEYITRGELADILGEFLPVDYFNSEIFFSDTIDNEYAGSIQKCVDAGIFNGYSDGTFKPENNVTNAELATVISKLKKNRAEAYELYSKINEKYRDLKSFTMDTDMDIDMDMKFGDVETQNLKTVSTGTFKAVINDLEKFDIELSGSLDTMSGEIGQKTNIYYKDNTYYIKNDDLDIKAKVKMDFNEIMSNLGLNYNDISELSENSIVFGYVKVKDDNTKDLYVNVDVDEVVSNFAFIHKDKGTSGEIGNISQVIHIDENDNMTGYDLYGGMKIEDELGYIDYAISAKYKLRDLNSTVADVPDDLDTYGDMGDLLNMDKITESEGKRTNGEEETKDDIGKIDIYQHPLETED